MILKERRKNEKWQERTLEEIEKEQKLSENVLIYRFTLTKNKNRKEEKKRKPFLHGLIC